MSIFFIPSLLSSKTPYFAKPKIAEELPIFNKIWDPNFYQTSCLFAPIVSLASQLNDKTTWPSLQDYTDFLQCVTNAQGQALHCVNDVPVKLQSDLSLGYEQQVYLKGHLPTRLQHWHDYLNCLVWRLFPKTKACLNARQFAEFEKTQSLTRTVIQQCFAHFDETGIVIICHCPKLAELLIHQQWHDLFYTHRQAVIDNMQWIIFGHGLYEKLLNPYVGITGKGILLCDSARQFKTPALMKSLDGVLSRYVDELTETAAKKRFVPVPLLGIPNVISKQDFDFYRNTDYFRPLSDKVSITQQEKSHIITVNSNPSATL